MMRVIAERHHGRLPLETVESIWRVIIATFTYVQSNYAVHADMSGGGDTAMRDLARFHFGFTVPLIVHASAGETIEAVAASARADGGGDLGMLHAVGWPQMDRWWERLADENAPKIIARLPFVERPDHPAGTPVFIISNPLAEAAARDVALFSARELRSGAGRRLFPSCELRMSCPRKIRRRRLDAGVGAGRLERRKTCRCAQTGAGRRTVDR